MERGHPQGLVQGYQLYALIQARRNACNMASIYGLRFALRTVQPDNSHRTRNYGMDECNIADSIHKLVV